MTGWRLVAGRSCLAMPALERLAQTCFLAAATQRSMRTGGILHPQPDEFETRKADLRAARFFVPRLARARLRYPLAPQGAFYLYADCSRLTADSYAFANLLLEQTGIAATPGVDFGSHRAARHIRCAYTQPCWAGRCMGALDRFLQA